MGYSGSNLACLGATRAASCFASTSGQYKSNLDWIRKLWRA